MYLYTLSHVHVATAHLFIIRAQMAEETKVRRGTEDPALRMKMATDVVPDFVKNAHALLNLLAAEFLEPRSQYPAHANFQRVIVDANLQDLHGVLESLSACAIGTPEDILRTSKRLADISEKQRKRVDAARELCKE